MRGIGLKFGERLRKKGKKRLSARYVQNKMEGQGDEA